MGRDGLWARVSSACRDGSQLGALWHTLDMGDVISVAATVLAACVSLATVLGVLAELSGLARARRRLERLSLILKDCPARLDRAVKVMHFEAYARFIAVSASRAAYPIALGPVAPLTLAAGVAIAGVWGFSLGSEQEFMPHALDGASVLLAAILLLGVAGTASFFFGVLGSRKSFREHIFENLRRGANPDKDHVDKALHEESGTKEAFLAGLLGVLLGITVFTVSLFIGHLGIEQPTEEWLNWSMRVLVVSSAGAAWIVWYLLLRRTRVGQEVLRVNEWTSPPVPGAGSRGTFSR